MMFQVRVVRLRYNENCIHWSLAIIQDRLMLWNWLRQECRREPFLFIENLDYDGWLPLEFSGCPVIDRLQGSNLLFNHLLKRGTTDLIVRMEKMQLRRSKYCIGVSKFALETTGKLVDLSRATKKTIYNCVDTEFFRPAVASPAVEQSIVFVNSLNKRKGLEELFQAMPLILEEFPDVVLKLAGSGSDNYIQHLMSLLDPRYHKNIQFLGFVSRPELPSLLLQATVCCYPSHAETFGIAPVEAMAAGRPVIYSRNGPGPEMIEHGMSGLLADPHDPVDIARQVKHLLGNPDVAARLALKGRQRAEEMFSKDKWMEANLKFYRDTVKLDLSRAGLRD
jgi:glycosyltransferase involved in cell wall biosynthesis